MKSEEQLVYWLCGSSVHNQDRDECTPDFSCCGGKLSTFDVRLRFVLAHRKKDLNTIDSMLIMFLGNMIDKEFLNKNIRVGGTVSDIY